MAGSDRTILEALKALERELKAQTLMLESLMAQSASTQVKSVFSLEELAQRWSCTLRYAREVVRKNRIPCLRGSTGKLRRPLLVLRESLQAFEAGQRIKLSPKVLESPRFKKRKPVVPCDGRLGCGVRRLGD